MPPPIPFPHPSLALGTDLLHLPRLSALLHKSSGRYRQRFLQRVLTPHERSSAAYISKLEHFVEGAPSAGSEGGVDAFTRWVGGRWAAKEAAFKALYSMDGSGEWDGEGEGRGKRRWGWGDVEVRVGEDGGAPFLVLYDPWDAPGRAIVPPRREARAGVGQVWGAFANGNGLDESGNGWETGSGSGNGIGRGKGRQGRVARVSISHDGEYVTAVAMVAF
jgi:phosphopantetheinyl transferase (holo-ACP synthase)